MKKLNSLMLCGLITPVMFFTAGAAISQQTPGQDIDSDQQRLQSQPGVTQSSPVTPREPESAIRSRLPATQTATEREIPNVVPRVESRGYLNAAPRNSIRASELMGVEVRTLNDEEVGVVSDLVFDDKGQLVGVVVGVGGFLGIGEKDVAIGWDDISISSTPDDKSLQMNQTLASLRSAPRYVAAE